MRDAIDAFGEKLAERPRAIALISRPENVRYLTGYTGEGWLLVGEGDAAIVTDSRYWTQVERQWPSGRAIKMAAGRKGGECVRDFLRERAATEVLIEADHMTVSVRDAIQSSIGECEISPLGDVLTRMRAVKTEREIALIRRASDIAVHAFDRLLGLVKPGMTERQIALELNDCMLRGGADRIAFETIVASGENGALPHATPGERKVERGDLITFDFGAEVQGYKTDMTRTIALGHPGEERVALYEAVCEAQAMALQAIKPGAMGRDIDKIARDYLDARYPGAFGHSLGHGVGLMIHESPTLGVSSDWTLARGHVVTVEPGVYLERLGGCRIEDTVVVTEDGCENLIATPKTLLIL